MLINILIAFLFNNSKCGLYLVISWNNQVDVHGVIHNDPKSVWLLGEANGEVHIAFLVSLLTSIKYE